MSENNQSDVPVESQETGRSIDALTHKLGQVCVAEKGDIVSAVTQVEAETGLKNPNSADGSFLFSDGDVLTDSEHVYRQVGIEAIEDLIKAGVVRNGATAKGAAHPRWGHRVFWHRGQNDRFLNTGGRYIVVTTAESAERGWVTIDEVTAIYTKDEDGAVVDLLAQD